MQKAKISKGGFTLIEALIYFALFTLIFGVAVSFMIGILRSSVSVRSEQVAVANAALVLRAVELETRHADKVYTSTSIFDVAAGQLSLRTPRFNPTDHEFAFVDFYLDNGVVYEKRDGGSAPVALTGGDVNISVLRFEHKSNGNAEGIRIVVTAQSTIAASAVAEAKTLSTFIVLRPFSA